MRGTPNYCCFIQQAGVAHQRIRNRVAVVGPDDLVRPRRPVPFHVAMSRFGGQHGCSIVSGDVRARILLWWWRCVCVCVRACLRTWGCTRERVCSVCACEWQCVLVSACGCVCVHAVCASNACQHSCEYSNAHACVAAHTGACTGTAHKGISMYFAAVIDGEQQQVYGCQNKQSAVKTRGVQTQSCHRHDKKTTSEKAIDRQAPRTVQIL